MSPPITVTVEGGGSWEPNEAQVDALRSVARSQSIGQPMAVSIVAALAVILPPEPPPELDRSAWWSALARGVECRRVVLMPRADDRCSGWTILEIGSNPVLTDWPYVRTYYTDFKRLEIDP